MSAPTPKEIRAARAYLYKHGLGFIRAIKFAASAKELDISFKLLHKVLEPFLGRMKGGRHGKEEVQQAGNPA